MKREILTYAPIPAFTGSKLIAYGFDFTNIIEQSAIIIITSLVIKGINSFKKKNPSKKMGSNDEQNKSL